ncbi:MAG TPA: hypothetical protein VF530_21025 [Planctomycetota bacterium]
MLLLLLARTLLAGVTVSVPSEGWVRGTEIELGELCTVTGPDAALVARARALRLGYAPAPGFRRVLTQDRIREELARALPGCAIRVTGERLCAALPEVEEFLPERLEAAARREIERAFAGIPASFTLLEPLEPELVPRGHGPGGLEAVVSATAGGSGTYGVTIGILVDGQRYRSVWTSWRVDVWETRPAVGSRNALPSLLGTSSAAVEATMRGAGQPRPAVDER